MNKLKKGGKEDNIQVDGAEVLNSNATLQRGVAKVHSLRSCRRVKEYFFLLLPHCCI